MKDSKGGLWAVESVAWLTGATPATVASWIGRGFLTAKRVRRRICVSQAELDRFLARYNFPDCRSLEYHNRAKVAEQLWAELGADRLIWRRR